MSRVTFTPGPWRVESDGVAVAIGGQVCIVDPSPDDASREEAQANARLIAAAPDLLIALRACLAVVEGLPQGHSEQRVLAANAGRAALAKAELREP